MVVALQLSPPLASAEWHAHVFNDAGYAQYDQPSYCAAQGAHQGVLVHLASPARSYPAGLYSICIAPLACVCLSAYHPLPSIPITRDCVAMDLAGEARSPGRRGCSQERRARAVRAGTSRHPATITPCPCVPAGACLHTPRASMHTVLLRPSKYNRPGPLSHATVLPSNRRTKRCSRSTINSASRSK